MVQHGNDDYRSRFSDLPREEDDSPGEHDDQDERSTTSSSNGNRAPVDTPATLRPGSDVNLTISSSVRAATQLRRGQAETVISERTSFEGISKTDETLRVRGTMQGEVESKSFVIIEEQGKVTAQVRAAAVTVAGRVDGKIMCTERAELMPTAHVMGEIIAPKTIMREGAYFNGNLKMGSASEQAPLSPGHSQA